MIDKKAFLLTAAGVVGPIVTTTPAAVNRGSPGLDGPGLDRSLCSRSALPSDYLAVGLWPVGREVVDDPSIPFPTKKAY
ncbi:hypothetical protein [Siphonobacter sp. SORGH_AS_1065]|uniref:hypothetical protein n=1 Tax=Siphonobacter sp. SORGH_AS_1065 TaxID=3041795 RepID=UPI00278B1C50|nr:hypothetical protein [Siphonobacter sp. SORGH_AS_1065]MDQ1090061.1 hypothetical protein [Siphonobacter sp. SORGH_AS_1065]